MISHNEVDTHTYSPDTIHKEPAARPLSFHFTSAQTITEENDSKRRLTFVTWHCSDLEVLGYVHAFKTSVYNQLADEPRQQQRMRNSIPTEGERSEPCLPKQ